jgi:hypothetical protein
MPPGPVTRRHDLDLGRLRQFRIVATLARAIPSAVVLVATPAGAPLARVGPAADLPADEFHRVVVQAHREQSFEPLNAALRLPPSSCPHPSLERVCRHVGHVGGGLLTLAGDAGEQLVFLTTLSPADARSAIDGGETSGTDFVLPQLLAGVDHHTAAGELHFFRDEATDVTAVVCEHTTTGMARARLVRAMTAANAACLTEELLREVVDA